MKWVKSSLINEVGKFYAVVMPNSESVIEDIVIECESPTCFAYYVKGFGETFDPRSVIGFFKDKEKALEMAYDVLNAKF